MIDGVEGVGEAVTGIMVARAIEPAAGEASGQETACLNCGAALVGAYCHQCGQTGHIHRTLSAWWHDLAHGVLHLDGKVWRTLPLLAWKPGQLTRRYIEGERAKFVSPMAIFLFSVFLMFAAFSLVGGPLSVNSDPAGKAEAVQDLKKEQAERASKLEELRTERAALQKAGDPTTAIDARIADLEQEAAMVAAAAGVLAPAGADLPDNESKIDANSGWEPLDQAIEKAGKNPSLLFYKVQTNAYKFSWALIPLSVPFVWLLFFWKRRFRVYDHTVFVTYSIAFMSLGLVALSLAHAIGVGEALIGLAIMLVPPLHMYRQLKGAYGLSRFGALWRTLMLINFAFVAGGLFFTLLVTMGALS